jgi:carbon storage regulator
LLSIDPNTYHLLREKNTMLVLSRKVGEEIVIGGRIRVSVVAVKGSQVRIGITAPPEVRVDREEVFKRIQEFAEPVEVIVNAR